MVNPTPTSFYADGTSYDEAEVVTNDHPSSSQASAAPSSFFTDGGLVGAEDVTHNDVTPSGPSSPMPSSFFTDGGLVGAETVTNNDNVPDSTPRPAPTSFYPDGNLYDFLSQESAVVALLKQLAATTTTNADAASTSASQSSTSASQAATSAANAAASVQAVAGTATPIVDGTATVGSSSKWAHEDHVHPTDTSRASVTAVALKADKTYVDTQDAAGKSYTDAAVAPKADKTYVDTQDAAGKTYTDAAVAPKANTTYVDAADNARVKLAGGQTLTGGFTITSVPLGTLSSFTPNPLLGNYQYGYNNGAFTITAPTVDCAVDILLVNLAAAGAITFSGFRGGLTGEPLTTANGSCFLLSIRRIAGVPMYIVKALQ
jgi:hypothetical protein